MFYCTDWIGRWIQAKHPKLCWLPTAQLSRGITLFNGVVVITVVYCAGLPLLRGVPGDARLNPATFVTVAVIAWGLGRVYKIASGEPTCQDGYLNSLSAGTRLAIFVWRIYSCERMGAVPMTLGRSRPKLNRTLG